MPQYSQNQQILCMSLSYAHNTHATAVMYLQHFFSPILNDYILISNMTICIHHYYQQKKPTDRTSHYVEMNPPQYQCLCMCACIYFSPLQQNDKEEENNETSTPHHPNITLDHNQTLLKALKASNCNYQWAPLYLTNDLETTTWNNNQKQDTKMTLSSINDATSCMPSSQSKMTNLHLKTTISH